MATNQGAQQRKFIELQSSDRADKTRVFLQVLSESGDTLKTQEVFSLGIRDVSSAQWKNRTVRWSRKGAGRVMEPNHSAGLPYYKIVKVHAGLPPSALLPTAMVYGQDAEAELKLTRDAFSEAESENQN